MKRRHKQYDASEPDKHLCPEDAKFILTGDYRHPLRDEWYLSGAIPEAWHAPNDMKSSKFWILRMVQP